MVGEQGLFRSFMLRSEPQQECTAPISRVRLLWLGHHEFIRTPREGAPVFQVGDVCELPNQRGGVCLPL